MIAISGGARSAAPPRLLAHGTNDAQKTMGVMTLALMASGHWTDTTPCPSG